MNQNEDVVESYNAWADELKRLYSEEIMHLKRATEYKRLAKKTKEKREKLLLEDPGRYNRDPCPLITFMEKQEQQNLTKDQSDANQEITELERARFLTDAITRLRKEHDCADFDFSTFDDIRDQVDHDDAITTEQLNALENIYEGLRIWHYEVVY